MPALVAGIHVLLVSFIKEDVDGRDEPGHDVESVSTITKVARPARHFGASAARPVIRPSRAREIL
jgi:hypothetical protein